ncbi:MAG TPA: phosphotransferase [Myxococcota bacterium]|nr:phosphotransferase [Myxococcota bacterium]
MSLRQEARRAHPDFAWLEPDDAPAVEAWLRARGWLAPNESFVRSERAGEGNMNLVLRIHTTRRSLVVKQARPWVEKYDQIAAPWDRALVEQRFYARVAEIPLVAAGMPKLLAADAPARAHLLEDLSPARDCAFVYAREGAGLGEPVLVALACWLRALHAGTAGPAEPAFANREMRALQAEHVFHVPYADPPALDLDALEPGLAAAGRALASDAAFRAALAATEAAYLADGRCLVHGDFFPGSWLLAAGGVRVIDPEFGFWGDPELDLGVAVAHLALAGAGEGAATTLLGAYRSAEDAPAVDLGGIARSAAAEVARRVLGVAQLPLRTPAGGRAELVARAREAMVAGEARMLFGS